jgi:hypothetical protein
LPENVKQRTGENVMSKLNIYDILGDAIPQVSAYVIVKNNERVATIAFKFPRDGAGRLFCCLHVLGLPMIRSFASGYGCDKKSAAASAAAVCVPAYSAENLTTWQKDASTRDAIVEALRPDNGLDWDRRLRDAGFTVWQAV